MLPATPQKCGAPDCEKEVPPDPGHGWFRRKYCSDECSNKVRKQKLTDYSRRLSDRREELGIRSAADRARKFLSNRGLVRNRITIADMLSATLIEMQPSALDDQREQVWDQLRELRKAVALGDVEFVQAAVPAIRILGASVGGEFARRVWFYCEEALRDVGEMSVRALEARTRAVEECGVLLKDRLLLCTALLEHANFSRMKAGEGPRMDYAESWSLLKGIADILDGTQWSRDDRSRVTLLRHQVAFWKIRLKAVYQQRPDEVLNDTDVLRELAKELNSPLVWVDTLREEAGYLASTGDYAAAAHRLDEARLRFSDLALQTPYTKFSLLRGGIDLSIRRN